MHTLPLEGPHVAVAPATERRTPVGARRAPTGRDWCSTFSAERPAPSRAVLSHAEPGLAGLGSRGQGLGSGLRGLGSRLGHGQIGKTRPKRIRLLIKRIRLDFGGLGFSLCGLGFGFAD